MTRLELALLLGVASLAVAAGFGVDRRDVALLNHIAVIRVNPARFPRVSAVGAHRFVDWLVPEGAQRLIQAFGVERYGEPLFFPDADAWRRKHRAEARS
jgi:ABC-type tungstate transport system permease subunit